MDDPPESFRRALANRMRLADCLALSTVPLVLVAVYLLPEPTRQALVFALHDPTLVTAHTAHFVHLSAGHLFANVVAYALLAGTGYLLAVLADARRLFGVAAATYLLGFPVVLSALNLAVPRHAVTYGFSGVVTAFAGLLALLLAVYAGRRIHPAVRVRHAPCAFLLALALVPLVALPPSPFALATAVAASVGAVGYGASLLDAAGPAWAAGLRPTARAAGWPDALVVGTLLFAASVFVGFPPQLRVDGVVVNAYVHLLGFCLAFIVPYVALEVGLVGVAVDPGADGSERAE